MDVSSVLGQQRVPHLVDESTCVEFCLRWMPGRHGVCQRFMHAKGLLFRIRGLQAEAGAPDEDLANRVAQRGEHLVAGGLQQERVELDVGPEKFLAVAEAGIAEPTQVAGKFDEPLALTRGRAQSSVLCRNGLDGHAKFGQGTQLRSLLASQPPGNNTWAEDVPGCGRQNSDTNAGAGLDERKVLEGPHHLPSNGPGHTEPVGDAPQGEDFTTSDGPTDDFNTNLLEDGVNEGHHPG